MLPVVVSIDHSAAEDVDCRSAASSGCAEGTDHDSTDWVVSGTSAASPAQGWCVDKYCS